MVKGNDLSNITEDQFEQFISQALNVFTRSSVLDYKKNVLAFMNHLRSMLEVDICYFFSFDQDTGLINISFKSLGPGVNVSLDKDFFKDEPVKQKYPKVVEKVFSGQPLLIRNSEDFNLFSLEFRSLVQDRMKVKSLLYLPVSVEDRIIGFFGFDHLRATINWNDKSVERLSVLCNILANVMDRFEKENNLKNSNDELSKLKDQLKAENTFLKQELKWDKYFDQIVGVSKNMVDLQNGIRSIARTNVPVMITGEVGTGKEVVSRAIHSMSPRSPLAFLKVNCATIREMGGSFGSYNRESATSDRITCDIDLYSGGTLFLENIGHLPASYQQKLIEFLGSPEDETSKVRLICSCTKPILEFVKKGLFRPILYFQLNLFPLDIKPLRDRTEDIPEMVTNYINKNKERLGSGHLEVPARIIEKLKSYSWPGNMLELENVLERALMTSGKVHLNLDEMFDLKIQLVRAESGFVTLEEKERNHIKQVLGKCNWKIEGPNGASKVLDINPSTLRSRMRKLGIARI